MLTKKKQRRVEAVSQDLQDTQPGAYQHIVILVRRLQGKVAMKVPDLPICVVTVTLLVKQRLEAVIRPQTDFCIVSKAQR